MHGGNGGYLHPEVRWWPGEVRASPLALAKNGPVLLQARSFTHIRLCCLEGSRICLLHSEPGADWLVCCHCRGILPRLGLLPHQRQFRHIQAGFSHVAILAVGEAFLLLRGIDLSVGSIMALAGMVAFDGYLMFGLPGRRSGQWSHFTSPAEVAKSQASPKPGHCQPAPQPNTNQSHGLSAISH